MKIPRLPLVYLFLFALNLPSIKSQECGTEALASHISALENVPQIIEKILNWSDKEESRCLLQKRAKTHYHNYDYKKAISYATALNNTYNQSGSKDSTLLFKNWEILSNSYFEMGLPDSVLHYGKLLLWELDARITESPAQLPRILEIVAMSFADQLQYDLALEWIDMIGYHLLSEGMGETENYMGVLYVKGVIKTLQMDMDQAISILDSIISSFRKFDYSNKSILIRSHALAIRLNIFIDDIASVENHIDKGQKLFRENVPIDTSTYISYLLNKSFYHLILGQLEKELILTNEALSLSQLYNKSPILFGKTLLFRAVNISDRGDINLAIQNGEKGLDYLNSKTFYSSSFGNLKSNFLSFLTIQLTNVAIQNVDSADFYYEKAWSYREILIDNNYQTLLRGNKSLSKFAFAPEDLSSIGESIEMLWNNSNHDKLNSSSIEVYNFLENYKSHTTNYFYSRKNKLESGILNSQLLNIEKKIRLEIDKILEFDNLEGLSDKELYDRNKLILERRIEYSKIEQQLLKDNKKIFDEIEEVRIFPHSKMLEILEKSNETLLSYLIQGNNVFLFLRNKDVEIFEKIHLGSKEKLVENISILNNFNSSLDSGISLKDYQKSSFWLYEHLILPVKDHLTEEIIIIPHKEIFLIPFSTLISSIDSTESNFKEFDFLINKYNFGYSSSISSYFFNSRKVNCKRRIESLVVAPHFKNSIDIADVREGLGALKFNIEEAKIIGEVIPGKVLIGEHSTTVNVMENASNYEVLHFATHAIPIGINQRSQLILKDDLTDSFRAINFDELFNEGLKSSLVVLSACNSGYGRIRNGEGIISLSNEAFRHGASVVISNLWDASDYSMKELFTVFYKELKEGEDISKSLRESKLMFLKNAPNEICHPFYWSGLIVNGYSHTPMICSNAIPNWSYVLVVVIIILLLAKFKFGRRIN